MSHKLANFFETQGYCDDPSTYRVSTHDYRRAINALIDDTDAFFLNGIISIGAAINSLNRSNFSWAFIQSYYSLFFFARAFNGLNQYAIIYINRRPYGIKIQPSEGFSKHRGNSHQVVLNQFKKIFAHDVLLQNQIEGSSPVDWFQNSRNHINYTLNPFTDPVPPISLYQYQDDLRHWILTYINDSGHLYTFDPKHCYIAYPIQLFLRIFDYYARDERINRFINEERLRFLKMNFSDDKGPIAPLIIKITDLAPTPLP